MYKQECIVTRNNKSNNDTVGSFLVPGTVLAHQNAHVLFRSQRTCYCKVGMGVRSNLVTWAK